MYYYNILVVSLGEEGFPKWERDRHRLAYTSIYIYKIYKRFDGGNSIFFPAIYLLFIEKISGKGGAAVAAVGELYTSNIEIDKNWGPAVANVNCTRAPYRVIGKFALKN